jgi:outer membrane protein TolC
LTNAQFNLTKNRSDYQLALLQLSNQIGVKDPASLQLANLNATVENVDVTELKDQSLPKRMELQQAEIAIRKAEQTVAQSKNQSLPQLDLTYNKSDKNTGYSIGYDFLNGDISGSLEGRTNTDSSYSRSSSNGNNFLDFTRNNIQLTLTWNLDFGTVKNQIKQDEITLENAKKSLDTAKQSAGWEIDQAIAGYRLAAQKVNANQQLLPYYQKQLDLKKLSQKLGSSTQPEVDTAEQNVLQAQLQVDLAQYDYFLAYQKLKQVTGGLYQ